jgi:hypothetical protein
VRNARKEEKSKIGCVRKEFKKRVKFVKYEAEI